MNTELEGMWREVVVAYFNILSWHSPGATDRNNEKSQVMTFGDLVYNASTSQIKVRWVITQANMLGRKDV
jgi:hypothetical protein